MAESCTICSSRSRRQVRNLLDTPSHIIWSDSFRTSACRPVMLLVVSKTLFTSFWIQQFDGVDRARTCSEIISMNPWMAPFSSELTRNTCFSIEYSFRNFEMQTFCSRARYETVQKWVEQFIIVLGVMVGSFTIIEACAYNIWSPMLKVWVWVSFKERDGSWPFLYKAFNILVSIYYWK
jgi:hypothetical protein